jgi:hypothetical protein
MSKIQLLLQEVKKESNKLELLNDSTDQGVYSFRTLEAQLEKF